MRQHIVRMLVLCMVMLWSVVGAWGAGYTRTLNDQITVAGYTFKAFYDFQTNTPEVLPTSGDLRYRDGNIWGLHNFGSGERSAVVNIPVSENDLIILQDYNGTATITGCTANAVASTATGYLCFNVAADAPTITISTPRYGGVVAAVVMSKDDDAAYYTVRCMCGEEELSSTQYVGKIGEVPIITHNALWKDETKYIYIEDDLGDKTIAEDGSTVVTIQYRVANSYSYSISSNVPGVSYSGTVVEGESITVAVPRYINVDGILYEIPHNGDNWYHHTYSNITADLNETLTYNPTAIENVVFYAEAEALTGATSGNGVNTRTSMGLTGYGTNLPVTTLPAGKYKIHIHGANGNSAARAVAFKNGEDAIAEFTIVGNNNNQDFVSEEIVLAESADITLTAEGSQASGVDYFYIVSTATVEYTVKYIDEVTGDELEEETKEGVAGLHPRFIPKTITRDYTTYKYVSDNINDVIIKADGSSVVTVTVSRPPLQWQIIARVNGEDRVLGTNYANEGDRFTVPFSHYINVDGTLWSCAPKANEYRQTIDVTENGQQMVLVYSKTDITNVVFYSEAEDISTLTPASAGNIPIRCSDAEAAYAKADALITTLDRGVYRMVADVYGSAGADFNFTVDGNIVYTQGTLGSNGHTPANIHDFPITENGKQLILLQAGSGGSSPKVIDLIYIWKVRDLMDQPEVVTPLRPEYKVPVSGRVTMQVSAIDAKSYQWYKSETGPDSYNWSAIPDATTDRYTHAAGREDDVTYYYCGITGYDDHVYETERIASVTTVEYTAPAVAPFMVIDYDNTSVIWVSSVATISYPTVSNNKVVEIENDGTGNRAAFVNLSEQMLQSPDRADTSWEIDFDFHSNGDATNATRAIQVYNANVKLTGAANTTGFNVRLPLTDCFLTLDNIDSDKTTYNVLVGNKNVGTVTIPVDQTVRIKLLLDADQKISASVVVGYTETSIVTKEALPSSITNSELGGLFFYRDQNTPAVYFDNIALSTATAQLLINSDLAANYEGYDDEYLNDGAGLNFDVPAATEFEWYVSSVAPSASANGTDAPKLNDDGSVTWTGGTAFMTVTSPVGRASTTITKTKGQDFATSGKHVVTPAATGDGSYAYQLVTNYPTVQTVWDEATEYHYNDGTGDKSILRYYPEATASGSHWHYLRQLDIQNSESDHLDYVWCVAKNALGEVTSKVAQINIYTQQPMILLHPDDETANNPGERGDMTIPANYMMRLSTVRILANNLIFTTAHMPVPYQTKSEIVFRDEQRNEYLPSEYPATQSTKWMHGETEWTGLLSTTSFAGLDDILEGNASVHGYYKNIPNYVPVDFVYGLRQLQGAEFHAIGSYGGAEYRIGPDGNPSLTATQEYYYDYGKAAATPFGTVSTKTTWDWSKLPQRSYMTYNTENLPDGVETKTYGGNTYVVDPETRLLGPLMGQEYLMADFYSYKPEELGGFPSDKVKLGLEVVNDPTNKCMQGNAFIFKPTAEGTLEVSFSKTEGGEDVYLTLNYDDQTVSYKAAGVSSAHDSKTVVNMTITAEMLDKEVSIKANNSSDVAGKYFRLYSATYTPDAKPVTFKEWKVKDRDMVAAGGVDEYEEAASNTDGYVSLATTTPGAVIKYKMIAGNEKTDEQLRAFMATKEYNNLDTLTYIEDVYTDSVEVDGIMTVRNKIGIHCTNNSTIFAWTEIEGMNRSEVTWHKTNAQVFPVDIRFMKDFDTSTITTQDDFDNTYWGVPQSTLGSKTMEEIKSLSTDKAPKAWNKSEYGKALIGGVEYTAANFESFFITHGTTIDIMVEPTSAYTFVGYGAPSFKVTNDQVDPHTGEVQDMMRLGAKAKYVHYHLLYDKAKAATTAGIAFIIANFTDREGAYTAQVKVTDETHDLYAINVDTLDQIIAPVYHTAHKADGVTVTNWTDYYAADPDGHYEDYTPGVAKKIYENTVIRPVYRDNTILDNYLGRSVPMTATWWFTTDHYAQSLVVANATPEFWMPYVAPVKRSQIGTATKDAADDITFDLPMTITPTPSGRLNNTIVTDWCSVGRGTTFTVPACKGAEVQMEVRSKLNADEKGTKFGGETPTLCKVKYKDEDDYTPMTDVSQIDSKKTVDSYVYTATYTGDASTLDIVLGNDYSYIRNISLTMPVIETKRDAALITLDFSELYGHLDLASLAGYDSFSEKKAPMPYGEGNTGDGYQFDHKSENVSLYRTHYSKEDGVIYYDGVSRFQVVPGQEIPDNVPYVNGILGYTYSTGETTQGTKISKNGKGTFIVGPFRSITHIRYKQGCSVLGGGGWTMTVGRMNPGWNKSLIQQNDIINKADDPRRQIPDFSSVQWGEAKYGSIHNSTTPQWVEMDIEEHIGIENIKADNFDTMDGDIWLKFEADKPNVYLFNIEIYGIDPTTDQQVTLETGILAAQKDEDTSYESSLRAGSIFHFPYLLALDEDYEPVSSVKGSDNKIMQYNEGREVSLTANPATGYDFLKWVKPDGNGGWTEESTANPYVFNIKENTELRAVFVHRGIINYTTEHTNYGIMPEQRQTGKTGDFTVADNRGLYAGAGQSLRKWQDALPTHEWYESTEGSGVSNTFTVSTNSVGVTTPSEVSKSRAMEGDVVDVYPQFGANTLELIDVVGRKGTTARWLFGKKNGALTMEGRGTTPRIVTQAVVTGTREVVLDNGTINEQTVTETIDVSMQMQADVNNAGRADEYATVKPANRYTIPATRGMLIEFNAKDPIQYSIDGGTTFQAYTEPFKYYGNDSELVIALRDATDNEASFELAHIQATYYQRAQKPVLSMQKVDVIGDGATNNIQVVVQTSTNPTATRFYTIDGSEPQYEATSNGIIPKPGTNTRLVRGNYITINESQIQSGTQLKVLSVCPDRPDSRLSTLDLEPYDPSLGLATYVYDSRIISIHNDQIFQKLLRDHKGHFNLLSYDLNPEAARIPDIITDHTTVFVTSDAVRDHLMTALTTPSDAAAHGQTFNVEPLIVGTPLTISWKASATEGEWQPLTWVAQDGEGNPVYTVNPATATSPATITYTEWLRAMKTQPTRVDPSKTYEQYYRYYGQIAEGDPYILAFYDNMLLDGSKLCISNTTTNAPDDLSANGTQLVFNATELLTRITNGTPADVSSFNSTLLALMGPTKNPQVGDIAMTYTQDVIDLPDDSPLWTALDAPMLSALSDGKTEMSMPYLASSYPQFRAGTINNYGKIEVKNVEVATADDDLATAEKLGAQGVKDLATIIELTDPSDAEFKREYRVEFKVTTEELTFHKEDGKWVCDEANDLCSIEESTKDGHPFFKLLGPQNYGIKSVNFNGYALSPDEYFVNGEIAKEWIISGRGEKFNSGDAFTCPTAYNVTEPYIPQYPENSEVASRIPLSNSGQWMTREFPWGFKDCNQLAFSLLNVTDYVGDIKVTYYRRQAESPKLVSAKAKYKSTELVIKDDMVLEEPNGEFVLEFNSVMHEVRKPGEYDSATGKEVVTWTVHIIDGDIYADALKYAKDNPEAKDRWSKIDEVDGNDKPGRIELSAEGGSNILRFQYWELEPGKKYYLHIPFHVLRGAVGTGVPYQLPANVTGLPEEHMTWTDYPAVPYFDIPFTVKAPEYKHQKFNYIVSNDAWWDVLKEDPSSPKHGEYPTAESLPSYATWDGDFSAGINKIKALTDGHERFYMHVQKKLNAGGKPVAYTYSGKDNYGNPGLIQLEASDFSITGEGLDSTIITARPEVYGEEDNYSGLTEDNNKSTLHLDGSKVYIQDMTLQNTQTGTNVDGQEYPALFDHGERNVFYNVNIDAYEESFAVFGSFSYLKNSRVGGYGDFVVGSGDVWLDSCDIVLRNRELINLCAPSTKATNKWGFIFNGCNITREAGATQVLDHNWTLARPWKGYDTLVVKSPAVTFLNTTMEVLPSNTGYGSLDENLVLRFHEYGTKTTDGALVPLSTRSIANCVPDPSSDAPVLTPEEVDDYSMEKVFGRDNGGYDPEALTRQAKAPHLVNDGMVLHWNADQSDLCYLVYYLGDGEKPDWQHAQMFCCVEGTDKAQAYCYLTNHRISPVFRTGDTDKPISFSEMWYGRRKSNPDGANYDGDEIPGMGKASPSRLWFSVRAANQMGGLSPMSNALMYRAQRQYRTKITSDGVKQGDDSGKAYSTIYLDFRALAPEGVKAYALTDVSSASGDDVATTLTFERVNDDDNQLDVVLPNQGYLIYGPYTDDVNDKDQKSKNHVFIETTADPTVKFDHDSYLSGTIGTFLNNVTDAGLGETNEQSIDGQGWSINPVDYKNIDKGNASAFTLQKYNNTLGFYKFTNSEFTHHRAYLDTEVATRILEDKDISQQDAQNALSRGMRFIIRESDGTETDITSFIMNAEPKEMIYDLEGRRISSRWALKPGHIYIINGQKVLWGR